MGGLQYIHRQGGKTNFRYFFAGRQVTNQESLDYFRSLGIPPAWKDVKIAKSKKAKILATGFDKAGRLQYIYNPKFRARQDQEKFERILRFAEVLPKMRRTTEAHLRRPNLDRKKVLACIIQLMDQAYFRVGNEIYARENQSYGLTTIRRKHIAVRGDSVVFDFIGKSGQQQVKRITDRGIARIIKKLDELPGYEVFKYFDEDGELKPVTSNDVNLYIKEVMGDEFSAKDFRTWGGTLLATAELASSEKVRLKRDRKKVVTACVKKVAQKLGNTPAVTRSSYVDPRVIESYLRGKDLAKMQEATAKLRPAAYFRSEERCVLQLLSS